MGQLREGPLTAEEALLLDHWCRHFEVLSMRFVRFRSRVSFFLQARNFWGFIKVPSRKSIDVRVDLWHRFHYIDPCVFRLA